MKDTTIRKRVMARVEKKIEESQKAYDAAARRVDAESDAKVKELDREIQRVNDARESLKAAEADRIVDEIVKGLA